MRMLKPPHPGVFIKEELIDPNNLTITTAADVLGVDRRTLSNFVNAKSSLSPEMGLRIEKAFGIKMDTLMRMQTSFDIAKAKKLVGTIKIKRYEARV